MRSNVGVVITNMRLSAYFTNNLSNAIINCTLRLTKGNSRSYCTHSFNGFRDCLIHLIIKVQANEKENLFSFSLACTFIIKSILHYKSNMLLDVVFMSVAVNIRSLF